MSKSSSVRRSPRPDAFQVQSTKYSLGEDTALHVDNANNRVGVNTAFPSANLSVMGTTSLGNTNNQARFAEDGEITLIGTARVYKEVRIEAWTAKLGASAPVSALRQIGTTATMLAPVDQFSQVTQQDVYFFFHVPFDCDITASAFFHLMWLPGASWSSGNYMWKLEYIVKAEGADHTTVASTIIQADVTPANATDFIETEFAAGITLLADGIVYCHFYRDVANDNGNDTGDAILFEIEYVSSKLGEAT